MALQNDDNVKILLAVWGEKFVNDFLQFSLSSLLAPGNLPAMAKEYHTTFVILTRANQVYLFEESPAFQKLKALCNIEFVAMDDLIVHGNYSTTITLAYDRAIKNTGEQMLNTYFVFLVSDYIMADGSLEGLIRYMKKGYSGICAGNFQVLQDEIEDYVLDKIDPVAHVMQIKPRELLKKSFTCLHPIAVASFCDQPVLRNYHANRFFTRYDDGIMAGRFYLLHMLCIKPETMNYRVGSSCDYSFIPEMCPSGNIGIINDSDDYLVIEAQPKNHELGFINWGKYDLKHLCKMLSEWTTVQHRENAKHTIYFHARDILPAEKTLLENKLSGFIDSLASRLDDYPVKPYYNHPYWVGAITSFQNQRSYLEGLKDYDFLGLPLDGYATTFFKKWYFKLFGAPPNVFRWHYRFHEYQAMQEMIRAELLPLNQIKSVVLFDSYQLDFMRYSHWIKSSLAITDQYYLGNVLTAKAKLTELQQGDSDIVMLFVRMEEAEKIANALPAIKKILKSNGKLVIIIPNEKNQYSNVIYDFCSEFGYKVIPIFNANYQIKNIVTVHNTLTFIGTMLIAKINRIFSYSRKRRFLSYVLFGVIGTWFCFIKNCIPKFHKKNSGHCTNIVMTLTPNHTVSERNA